MTCSRCRSRMVVEAADPESFSPETYYCISCGERLRADAQVERPLPLMRGRERAARWVPPPLLRKERS